MKGEQARVTDRFDYISSRSNTEYGDVIPDDLLVKIMNDGINSSNGDVSQKWKNLRDYYDRVKNHLDWRKHETI